MIQQLLRVRAFHFGPSLHISFPDLNYSFSMTRRNGICGGTNDSKTVHDVFTIAAVVQDIALRIEWQNMYGAPPQAAFREE